jgi:hypothetical protein
MSFAYAAIHAVAYAYGELLLDRAEGDPMQLYPAFMKDMEVSTLFSWCIS